MKSLNKVLLINAHLTYPGLSEGRLNDAFQEIAQDFFLTAGFSIMKTKIETHYDAAEEVAKHMEADVIILQTPVNWFGAPWIYKKYTDEVFNAGYQTQQFLSGDGRTRADGKSQYGTGGKMQGKIFMVSATWNAPASAFGDPGEFLMQGRTAADLLLNITSNYRFCGVTIAEGFNSFDIFKDGDVPGDLLRYPEHLQRVARLLKNS